MLTLQQAIIARGLKDPKVKPYKIFTAKLAQVQSEGKNKHFPRLSGQECWHDKKEGLIMLISSIEDGSVNIDYPCNCEFTKLQVDDYVREYCRLNHLKGE